MRLSKLKAMRDGGALTRNEYWREIQEQYSLLLDLVSIIDARGVSNIILDHAGLTLELPDGSRLKWDRHSFASPQA